MIGLQPFSSVRGHTFIGGRITRKKEVIRHKSVGIAGFLANGFQVVRTAGNRTALGVVGWPSQAC